MQRVMHTQMQRAMHTLQRLQVFAHFFFSCHGNNTEKKLGKAGLSALSGKTGAQDPCVVCCFLKQ